MATPTHRSNHSTSFARLDAGRRVYINSVYYSNSTAWHVDPASDEDVVAFLSVDEEEKWDALNTAAQLQYVRQERQQVLLHKLEKEFEENPEQIEGTDRDILKARIQLLSTNLLQLNHVYFTMGLTSDRSLYGRVHLAAGLGTLHLELLLGDDVDPTEDTYVTLYLDKEQAWSLAGNFRQTLREMRQKLGLEATV